MPSIYFHDLSTFDFMDKDYVYIFSNDWETLSFPLLCHLTMLKVCLVLIIVSWFYCLKKNGINKPFPTL